MKWIFTITCLLLHLQLSSQKLGSQGHSLDFDIGTQWTYEQAIYPAQRISYRTYAIVDTMLKGEKLAFAIEPSMFSTSHEYMHIDGSQVYFWDEDNEAYQLNFDFDNDSIYHIKYINTSGNLDSTAVYVDSLTTEVVNGDTLVIQHIRSDLGIGNGQHFENFEVIKGIGLRNRGIRLPIGFVWDPISPNPRDLRCFHNGIQGYDFVDYSCDSTWFITSTVNFENEEVQVYPNPTDGHITIDGIDHDVNYELYTLDGSLVNRGKTRYKSLQIDLPGTFVLKMNVRDNWLYRKVVRVE